MKIKLLFEVVCYPKNVVAKNRKYKKIPDLIPFNSISQTLVSNEDSQLLLVCELAARGTAKLEKKTCFAVPLAANLQT